MSLMTEEERRHVELLEAQITMLQNLSSSQLEEIRVLREQILKLEESYWRSAELTQRAFLKWEEWMNKYYEKVTP